MSRTMRWSVLVLVLACLTVGTAQALPLAQLRPEIVVPDVGSRLVAAWDRLVSLVRPVESKPAGRALQPQRKGGCSKDPNGHPCA